MSATPESGAETTALVDPLGFMEKVTRSVYIYRPPTATSAPPPTSASGPRKAPKLVIVTAWMGARPPHVAKYLAPYRDGVFGEDPSERPAILLVFCHQDTTSSYSKAEAVAQTAVPFINDILGDSLNTTPKEDSPAGSANAHPQVLVHTLSNGGCLILGQIYNAIDPDHVRCLPPHVTIFDSSPGHFRFAGAATAFTTGLNRAPLAKRLVMYPAIYLLVYSMLVRIRIERLLAWFDGATRSALQALFGIQPSPKPTGPERALNPWTPHNVNTVFGGNRREVRRSYLYSDEDKIILSKDVEEHANEATGLGFTVDQMAKFPNSGHVSHARSDPERYWRIIKDTWLARQ
ncbi:uncharacterized protein SPSK_09526 [Sporothrix schenckii 1099-18]|uniref:Indole-diterpene biosynthesis protein PaxU n=2 Tax=Sporothrix schenckii TaxID=29908 RepID=U7Q9J8_SPOS1|nr:uncharacterized protein SPSK_09526 [Sporothrix schenckii 1099-18]ERT03431.1 hypothetical protein HMPREF1624_01746 [Sporothrix schenckii ATCC 58251]KJR84119.1 hypothetical protein SPSK_09526 [Sporothrix schenckii 1099-18]